MRHEGEYQNDDNPIWKFEDGLGENFSNWLSDIVGVQVIMNQEIKYSKQDYESNKLDKTPALIDNIKSLYRKEIGQLYPELAASL